MKAAWTLDDALLVVLIILRMNLENDDPTIVPSGMRRLLVERGWITLKDDPDDEERFTMHITEAGLMASDLFAPEIEVDPCPVGY